MQEKCLKSSWEGGTTKTNKSFQEALDRRLANVTLSESLQAKILAAEEPPARKAPIHFRRIIAASTAACLTLVLGISAAAGVLPGFDRFVHNMGSEYRQTTTPAQAPAQAPAMFSSGAEGAALDEMQSSPLNDIKVEAVASVQDGDSAVVYITVQDETGLRIRKDSELFGVSVNGYPYAWASMVHFDSASNTGTFRLDVHSQMLDDPSVLTLTIDGILNGAEYRENISTGYTLQDIMQRTATFAPSAAPLSFSVLGSVENPAASDKLIKMFDEEKVPLLVPTEAPALFHQPDWFILQTAGINDGLLHVRYQPESLSGILGSTEFYLSDASGKLDLPMGEISIGEPLEISGTTRFNEYEQVLPVPKGNPSEISLMAQGLVYTEIIEGDWQIAVSMEQQAQKAVIDCNIDLGTLQIHRMEVSPISLTLFGEGSMSAESAPLTVAVYLQDGSVLETISTSLSANDIGEIQYQNTFERPVLLADISKIIINGQTFVLPQ